MDTGHCPECNFEIELPRPREGQRLACPQCGADLEVINSHPIELDWAYADPDDDGETLVEDDSLDDEDWDEDWDQDEMIEGDEDWDEH